MSYLSILNNRAKDYFQNMIYLHVLKNKENFFLTNLFLYATK